MGHGWTRITKGFLLSVSIRVHPWLNLFSRLPPWRSCFSNGHRYRRFSRSGSRVSLNQAQCLTQFGIEVLADVAVVLQELPRIFAALADSFALVAEPGSALLHHVLRHAEIQQIDRKSVV